MHIADREIVRKGFSTDGIKESLLAGWNRLADATKQYTEMLEPEVLRCKQSGLTSATSVQLYVCNCDNNSSLSVSDQIFLQADHPEIEKLHQFVSFNNRSTSKGESFVKTAANLGVTITPHERRVASILPPLYQDDHQKCISHEFEQINEDMFSRKDNKFMVFNAAGVDSWTGKLSITKVRHNPVHVDPSS